MFALNYCVIRMLFFTVSVYISEANHIDLFANVNLHLDFSLRSLNPSGITITNASTYTGAVYHIIFLIFCLPSQAM